MIIVALALVLVAAIPWAQGISQVVGPDGDDLGNKLDGASDVAVDTAGTIYVTGYNSNNAFKITPAGAISTSSTAQGMARGPASAVHPVWRWTAWATPTLPGSTPTTHS